MSDTPSYLIRKHGLSLIAAQTIAAAAQAYAQEKSWRVVIAVVDEGGHLLCLNRMDGAQLGSIQVAQDKAYSALAFKRPTKTFSEALQGGRLPVLALQGAMPVEGGLPLIARGEYLGAIGVSGVTSEQDGEIAQAGSDAFATLLLSA